MTNTLPSSSGAESVPWSLFHAGRAQCPDCGAALGLVDHRPLIQCEYCGGTAVVQRRLRTIEPVISEGFLTADAPVDLARGVWPSHIVDSVAQDESHCPTCGVELEGAQTQAIRRCGHCGTESKIERRLLRSPDADEALAELERKADESQRRQFAATEALIEKVEGGGELAERVRAGHELGEYWCHANARAAKLLPRVLGVLRDCDVRLEVPLGELVGKLLCNEQIVLSNAVLRAAEKFTFELKGSHVLLRQLSLGSGAGVKLLLDTADYAGTRGATEYACSALWGVSTMIERNYAGRMRLAEIVLYRLLYLRGPVQSWAIELAQGQMGLGCRFPTLTLLQFIDDCAAERPELVPHIRRCFYHGRAENEGEYIARFELVDQLLTWPAKSAAIEQIYSPPAEVSEEAVAKGLGKLLAWMGDARLAAAAIDAIADLIDEDEAKRECIHAMVREHGDKLPPKIRISYLRKFPGSKLLTHINPWDFPPAPAIRTAFDEQLDQWKGMWGQGIRRVVEEQQERYRVAREYWAEISRDRRDK